MTAAERTEQGAKSKEQGARSKEIRGLQNAHSKDIFEAKHNGAEPRVTDVVRLSAKRQQGRSDKTRWQFAPRMDTEAP